MIVLTGEKITKSYSEKILLNQVSFYLNHNDKIGIVGVNGTGKSTLLKILSGIEEADAGNVISANGIRISYLPQNPDFENENTVLEQVLSDVSATDRDVHEYEAKMVLTKLGITEFEKKTGELSGGQKKRMAIAACLIRPSEILILDEPTNHLDNASILWLEEYLQKYTGAIVMITHDRYFLDRVTNRIVEIDSGALYYYEANYSGFLQLKMQREEMAVSSERKRQAFLRRELEWAQRGVRARGTKSRSRMERYEQIKEQAGIAEKEKLAISSVNTRLGKKTIEIEHISKSYHGNCLIKDFSYNVLRNDRIGIVGSNGTGKSTLLKLITGEIKPDSGTIDCGDTVKLGYFSQEGAEMDLSMRVIDYMKEVAEYVNMPEGQLSVSQLLEQFLFSGDLQWNVIGKLSGGERRRLLLLRILISAPNILILDEPTNDLDIETLAILENYLTGFDGAVITVSHDRYFLDKVAEQIFELNADGIIRRYVGGYSDYQQARVLQEEIGFEEKKDKAVIRDMTPKKIKFSFNEQREFDTIEDEIAGLEKKIEDLEAEIESQTSDFVKLQEMLQQKESIQEMLDKKTERWIYLTDLAEQIQNQS